MRLTRTMIVVLVAAAAAFALTACEDNKRLVIDDDNGDPDGACTGQETPEAVLATLIEAYNARDIDLYAPLLHPDFVFRFQDGDGPPGLDGEYWTRGEDSTGTAGLFTSDRVADITLGLDYDAAEPAAETGLTHTMKIRARVDDLRVDDVGGTTYLVTHDVEDYFFVRGDAPDTCWYLVEWRDIWGGGPGAQGNGGQGREAGLRISWGRIKTTYN